MDGWYFFPTLSDKAYLLLQSTSCSIKSVGKTSHHLLVRQTRMWAIILMLELLKYLYISDLRGIKMPFRKLLIDRL